ncbi:MAG: tyrosine/phenylalanine carboxypeptidase domain-containing protein [Patescibacteria group bacterium]
MEKIQSHEEKLDSRWYKRFEEVAFEDYEKLTGKKEVREAEKGKFLNGEVDNPTLDYPELESFNLEEREHALLALKEDVLELEKNDAVKKIYRTKINESLATLRMLKAAREGNDKMFSRYADFIYGTPEIADIGYVLEHVKELVQANLASEDANKAAAAQKLHAVFSEVSLPAGQGADKSILPEGEDISGKLESVDEAVAAFEEALQEIDATDWKVVVDTESGISNFSVSQEHKVVRVPAEDKLLARNISKKKLKGLIEHEIKTHVARRSNGERSRLQLLGLGLDRYLKAEEGIATYNEQQVTGAKEFAGVPRFFSIALAKGITGEKLDFRRTHEIMSDYRLLASPKKDVTPEAAATTAYNDCVRIFRGTTCKTPGAVYPKDMSYFGNRAIWTLASENSEVVETFTIGKYDPNNSEHIALLTQLGILDQDLEDLEK